MSTELGIASPPLANRNDRNMGLCWKDNVPAQKFLDVIASIIAAEYIQVAKKNPKVFTGSKLT